MRKRTKVILISALLIIITLAIVKVITIKNFGSIGLHYSQEDFERNLIDNKNDFQKTVTYFDSIVPKKSEYLVLFGKPKRGDFSLYLYPKVIDPKNKILGADNLKYSSTETEVLLKSIGWSINNVKHLLSLLRQTNCDSITTDDNEGRINLSVDQSDWCVFNYECYMPSAQYLLKNHQGKTFKLIDNTIININCRCAL